MEKIIEQRYSCRSYTSENVSEDALEYIKKAVQLAPSAVNKQPWKFRIVKSEEAKEKVRKCYDREWFATAPMYIIASVLHDVEWVRADGKPHGNIDIAIAVEHLCLAATAQGLGTCWVCNFDANLCHELFDMDETEEAAVLIPLGHPAIEATQKKRKEMNEVFTIV